MKDLDLLHVADTRVGGNERGGGLSGGQKRRLTIAIELVTFPSIFIIDFRCFVFGNYNLIVG